MRCRNGVSRSGYAGRRGMRVPSIDSTMRPSASAMTRATPMNSRKNGTPMIRIARPSDSDEPGGREREVGDAGHQREQQVQQATGRRADRRRCRRTGRARELRARGDGRAQGLLDRGLVGAVRVRDLVGRAVARDDAARARRPRRRPGAGPSSARRCSSASYSASCTSAGSAPCRADRRASRYCSTVRGVAAVMARSPGQRHGSGWRRRSRAWRSTWRARRRAPRARAA